MGVEKDDDLLEMNAKERSRLQVLEQLKRRQLRVRQAAEQLHLSARQVLRLKRAYLAEGARALVSKRRGRPSNHQLDPTLKQQALDLLQTHYPDFGPTLACEKLTEQHGLPLGVETVRRLQIQAGLWHPHHAKRPTIHPLRERRARFGELIQIDGSPFDWFEGRAPKCSLLVFIDDATSQLVELFFTPAETTFAYFAATERYLRRYGKPLAFYADKLGVFRINVPRLSLGPGLTQFTRAVNELGIDLICANSPQAKGRVEKAHQTLQDRLVKELRLHNISSLEAANAFVPTYLAAYNRHFAVEPRHREDAHRPLLPQDDLSRILTRQEERHLSKTLTLQFDRTLYQIQTDRPGYALRQARVLVRESRAGTITIEYRGQPLAYKVIEQQARQATEVSSKEVNAVVSQVAQRKAIRQAQVPPKQHPWRHFKLPGSLDSP